MFKRCLMFTCFVTPPQNFIQNWYTVSLVQHGFDNCILINEQQKIKWTTMRHSQHSSYLFTLRGRVSDHKCSASKPNAHFHRWLSSWQKQKSKPLQFGSFNDNQDLLFGGKWILVGNIQNKKKCKSVLSVVCIPLSKWVIIIQLRNMFCVGKCA